MKKKILLIGGSSSVGKHLIRDLKKLDYVIISTYTRKIKKKINGIENIHLNLNCQKSINEFLCNKIIKNHKFDALVYLSAVIEGKNINQYSDDLINEAMQTNFIGFAKLFKGLGNKFSKNASIIILSSISAERGSYDPVYAASKGALISFMKSISLWMGEKIRINSISPGLIEGSSMYRKMNSKRRSFHKKSSSTRKLTKVRDLSKIIIDVIQPHWNNMNGAIIRVNGGSYT